MKITIIHHLQDRGYLVELLKHLSPLQQQGMVEIWHEENVLAGQKTTTLFWQKLEEADGVILLVSPDFLAEERFEKMAQFITQQESKRTFWVFPIWVRYCQWEITFLQHFKILPDRKHPIQDSFWKNQDYAFDVVVDELRRTLKERKILNNEPTTPKEEISPRKKMALIIKNLKTRPEPNERGQIVPLVFSELIKQKLDEYLQACQQNDIINIEGVKLSRAELLTKKAIIEFSEAYQKGWKKHIELQNRSAWSLTKDLEGLGNRGIYLYKRYQVGNMLEEARNLEPENVEILLESLRFLMAIKPKEQKKKHQFIRKIEQILQKPKNRQEQTQLYLTRLLKALNPPQFDRSLVQSVRHDFETIGAKNHVAYCDWLLSGANFVDG